MAWSHELLDEVDRAVFRRLAVFVGGFDLDAARAVCAEEDAVGALARLVDKSLVVADGERFRLPETIRQYADDRLRAAGERARGGRPPPRLPARARAGAGAGARARQGPLARRRSRATTTTCGPRSSTGSRRRTRRGRASSPPSCRGCGTCCGRGARGWTCCGARSRGRRRSGRCCRRGCSSGWRWWRIRPGRWTSSSTRRAARRSSRASTATRRCSRCASRSPRSGASTPTSTERARRRSRRSGWRCGRARGSWSRRGARCGGSSATCATSTPRRWRC